MRDNPIQLVVAAFQDEKTAKAALKELKKAQRAKLIKIENAAVLRKDEKGKLHIKETGDMGGGKGAVLGGVGGADETEDEITVEGVLGTFEGEQEEE